MQNNEVIFDNRTAIVGEDLSNELSRNDTVIISAKSFSIYDFDSLEF